MTPLWIVGVDLSTVRIDVAAIPLNEPPQLGRNVHLTHADIPQRKAKEPLWDPAERAILAHQATTTCLQTLHARGLDIHSCSVEHPAGKVVADVTSHAFGAACAALNAYPVSSRRPSEWRKLIGCVGKAVNAKEGGASRVMEIVGALDLSRIRDTLHDPNEHELDAIGVALAHRAWILRSEAAA